VNGSALAGGGAAALRSLFLAQARAKSAQAQADTRAGKANLCA
jgi:hypothetical protein